MARIAYVNGRYLRLADAAVQVEDRGHQFADAVYEVAAVIGGRILDLDSHIARLHRSLDALSIAAPMSDGSLRVVMQELLLRNRLQNASIYIQVSRGVAPRDHAFPRHPPPPGLVMVARRMDYGAIARRQKSGVKVITLAESRWARPDIKSTSLLANVLAKQAAREAGAFEAWFADGDGLVTEGTSSTAWIVTGDGRLVTRALDRTILPGITREAVLSVAHRRQMVVEERAFSVAEAKDAAEAFLTSTTSFVAPVVEIDGCRVGDGEPGPETRVAIAAHADYVERETGHRHLVSA